MFNKWDQVIGMGVKIFGWKSSNAISWQDVCVKDYDNYYGLDNISTPISHQKIWDGAPGIFLNQGLPAGFAWQSLGWFPPVLNRLNWPWLNQAGPTA